MGKLSVALSVGATGSVASVGGAYMLGAFGNGDLDIPTSLADFKKNNGGSAISRYFSGVLMNVKGKEGETWGNGSKPESTFLGSDQNKGEGRLVVNWEKFKCSPDQSDKWTGRIRWLWTFVNGDKGLALYASAKSNSTEASKLDVEGVIYALAKENGNWTIKYNQPSSTTAATISDLTDSNFPKLGDKFTETSGLKVKEYWGFTDTSKKLTELCKSDSILDGNHKPDKEFKGSWIWKHEEGANGNDKKPFDWSKSDHSWLGTFYGTMTPKLADLVTGFSGTWTEEYFVNKSLGINDTAA